MNVFETWLRQPTTIHGLGVVIGAAAAAAAHVFSADPAVVAAAGAVGYVLTQFGINDNSVEAQSLASSIEAVAALATPSAPARVALLAGAPV